MVPGHVQLVHPQVGHLHLRLRVRVRNLKRSVIKLGGNIETNKLTLLSVEIGVNKNYIKYFLQALSKTCLGYQYENYMTRVYHLSDTFNP